MEWRWADPYGQQRSIRTDELRAGLSTGVIPPNAPVWQKGWTEWKPAYEVGERSSSSLSAARGSVPAIPPPPLYQLQLHDTGVTTCVRLAADPVPGTSFIDCLEAFEADPEPKAVMLIA